MTLHEKLTGAVNEYLRRLRMENLSSKTYNNYESVLRYFTTFVSETDQQDEFCAVVAWKTKLFESGVSPATIKQYLTVLEIFFKAASHRSYPQNIRFAENPIDKTLMPKVPERPYEIVLTDEQVRLLYQNTPPNGRYVEQWPRNYAIIQILVNEKIRNAELLDLRLSDIDLSTHEMVINNGKGRKYRVVDISPLTETAITLYLSSGLRPTRLSDTDYLFGTTAPNEKSGGSRTGNKWHRGSGQWLSNVVERTVRAITGIPDVRTHDLRHVGSRVCLNAGESKEQLQGELGHSSITVTEIYCDKLNARRGRESAKATLAERDKWAELNKRKIEAGQTVMELFA